MNGALDSGVGYQLPDPLGEVINDVLSVFARYRIDQTGTLIKGPGGELMNLAVEIPMAPRRPPGKAPEPDGDGWAGAPSDGALTPLGVGSALWRAPVMARSRRRVFSDSAPTPLPRRSLRMPPRLCRRAGARS
jgi:hypothetical protein